jgi:ketosteroid isomerase-like protein
MARGEAGAVRISISAKAASREQRTLEARLAAAMPKLANRLLSPVMRLPPRSRVRRWMLARMVAVTFSAINRRDLGVVAQAAYAPDVELLFHGGAPADIGGDVHRGREAVFATYRQWIEAWEELRRLPVEVVDMGERILVLVRERGRGRGGVELEGQAASLFTFRSGRVVRQDEYPRWRDALVAVGLPSGDARAAQGDVSQNSG